MTWANISSLVTGATVIKFCGKNNSLIGVHRSLLIHGGRTSLPFDHVTLINLYISPVIKGPQGLHSSTQILKSLSTSCFKYFGIINFARKTNSLTVVDLLAGRCIYT